MNPSNRDQFTIAIICALVEEANAVEALFDEVYDRLSQVYGKARGDRNAYVNGRMGKHEVVLCYMPNMGKGSAAMVASDLRFSYTNIKMALVAGVCGGVPKRSNGQPIFLGDTIISDSVIQYDFGKQHPNGFRRKQDVKDTLGRPSHELRALIAGLSGDRTREEFQCKMVCHIQKMQKANPKWCRPTSDDILFESFYIHKHHEKPKGAANCICLSGDIVDGICENAMKTDCVTLGCEQAHICRRREQADMGNTVVHIGAIASADTVMKSGTHRDKLADAEEVIGLEMEGAGVWDNFPCIIIKGVCDYADSHKDNKWQLFAAANAAAAARTLLDYVVADDKMVEPVVKIDEQVQWMVPFPRNPKFVGRHDQIKQLRALISDPTGPRQLAITGLGGAGKTQVALELAYQIRDADPDCSILWIPCTSQENVEQAYMEIVRRLQLSGQIDATAKVQTYLTQLTSKKWILIFDNADSEHMWIKGSNPLRDFVPDNEHGRTLYTSRNGQLAMDLADSYIIRVAEFDIETGKEFLRRSLLQQDLLNDHNTVKRFLEKLTFLPLAIAQAVAYVNKNQIGLSTYLELLDKQETEMIEILSENFQDKWRYKDVKNPVATAWWISFQQIQQTNPVAAEYLSFMGCINPRDIPQFMLPPASSNNEKIKAIGLLKSYEFVSDSEPAEDKLLNIHRLVHLATRNWMRLKRTLGPQILAIADQLGTLLGDDQITFSLYPMPDGEELPMQCLPHALTLLREDSVQKEQNIHTKLTVGVLGFLSTRFKGAEDQYAHFIRLADMDINHNHFILPLMILLGYGYGVRQGPQAMKKVLGQYLDRPTTKSFQDRVSMQLRTPLSTNTERAIPTALATPGGEVVSALGRQHDLAILYTQAGRIRESENLHLQTARNSSKVLGPDHPITLGYQASLAKMYCALQESTKAEEIYLEIIKASNHARGPSHFDSMYYQYTLARLYCKTGQYSAAEQIYVQLAELSKAMHGPRDIRTLDYQFELARVYGYQKQYETAEELMIYVIKTRELMRRGPKTGWNFFEHLKILIRVYDDGEESKTRKGILTRAARYRERLAEALPLKDNFPDFAYDTMVLGYAASLHEEISSLNGEMATLNELMIYLNEEMVSIKGQLVDSDERVACLEKRKDSLDKKLVLLKSRKSSLEKERSSLEEEGISWGGITLEEMVAKKSST